MTPSPKSLPEITAAAGRSKKRRIALGMIAFLVGGGFAVHRHNSQKSQNQENAVQNPLLEPARTPIEKWESGINAIAAEEAIPGEIRGLLLADFPVDDAMLTQLAGNDSIRTLCIDAGQVTDDGLDKLIELPNLLHLRLRLSAISDDGLKTIGAMEQLQILNLPQADCTDAGIGHLIALKNLNQLRIGSTRLTNGACEQFARLGSLTSLHTIGIPIQDDGLKRIAAMKNLQSLYIDDSQVTREGWDWLLENRPDLHLHVNQQHLDRDPHRHEDTHRSNSFKATDKDDSTHTKDR